MMNLIFFVLSIIFFVVGIILFYFARKTYIFRQTILQTPTSKAWDLNEGLVEMYGEVVESDKSLLISPITRKECVYYKIEVKEYRSSGKSGHYVTILKDEKHLPFLIKDLTGQVLVDPRNAKIELFNKYYYKTGFLKKMPPEIFAFIQKSDIDYELPLIGYRNMIFEERTIKPYTKLYILGTVKSKKEDKSLNSEKIIKEEIGSNPFYISDAKESVILHKYKIKMSLTAFFGALMIIMGIYTTYFSIVS